MKNLLIFSIWIAILIIPARSDDIIITNDAEDVVVYLSDIQTFLRRFIQTTPHINDPDMEEMESRNENIKRAMRLLEKLDKLNPPAKYGVTL